MRFSEIFDTLGEVFSAMRSSVLPLFAITVAIEMVALAAFQVRGLDELLTQPAVGLDQLFARSSQNPRVIMVLAVVLVAVTAFQLALFRPLRAIMLEDAHFSLGEAAREAAGRAVPAFITVNIVNFVAMLTVVIAFVVGASVSVIPQYMTFFVLFPAVYLVAARKRAILNALGDSLRWSGSLRYGPWLMGVQALSLVLAAAVSWLAEFAAMIGGLSEVEALPIMLVGGYATYKFAQFILFSTVFVAVDADDEATHA